MRATGAALLIAMVVGGCGSEARVPAPAPAPAAAASEATPRPVITAAAAALAARFAPELVGVVEPSTPVAGDYAMALDQTFETFVTTELRISDRRTGAMRLTLGPDGAAHACVGARHHHVSAGQYHYERDPAKRQHAESDEAGLEVFAGAWQIVDGVAVIRFDRQAGATCDPSAATVTIAPHVTELRCVATAATDHLPVPGLLCEASASSRLLDLGMPMTPTSGPHLDARRGLAPSGHQFVLGTSGVRVEVTQGAHDHVPSITFSAGVAALVETDYVDPR